MTRGQRHARMAIPTNLIAPCGMNCRLCWGYIREHNTCPGYLVASSEESQKSSSRLPCAIRNCEQPAQSEATRCSSKCKSFPCRRLKQLDKRYRIRYRMGMIENLAMIEQFGIRHFIRNEKRKWLCPECGLLLCVHKPKCTSCGHGWPSDGERPEV